MHPSHSQLSARRAWAMGALCLIAGLMPILVGLGLFVPAHPDPHAAPPWVLVCAGLVFVAAGFTIVLVYGIAGGTSPGGDLPAETSPGIRAIHFALGMSILVLMTAVCSWVAFGPGPREFSATLSLPFLPAPLTESVGSGFGRVVFAGAAMLMGLICVWCGVSGVARLWRAGGKNSRGRALLAVLLIFSSGSCAAIVRQSGAYKSFVASHTRIAPGMSIREVFDAGLADYLVASGGKNVPGATVPERQPVSADCRRHVVDVHHGTGSAETGGGFSVRVYCNMNGLEDRQLVPAQALATKLDLLQALDTYSPWLRSMSFRVESPPLQIGGVYDSYTFSIDANGRVASISSIHID